MAQLDDKIFVLYTPAEAGFGIIAWGAIGEPQVRVNGSKPIGVGVPMIPFGIGLFFFQGL